MLEQPSTKYATAALADIQTLVDLVQMRAALQTDRTAFTFYDGDEIREEITFAQLDRRARALATAIHQQTDVGARVLLVYPAGLEFIAAFFGCLYAGVLPVPGTYPKPRRPMPRLLAIARDCGASLALTSSQQLDAQVEQSRAGGLEAVRWLSTDTITDDGADDWTSPTIRSEDLAFLQYTSGSTSQPKGAMISHANLLHNLEMIRQGFDIQSDENESPGNGVFWLPAYHDMGLIGGILETLYVGGRSVLMSPTSFLQRPLRWLQAMSDYRARVSGAPNFAFDLCVAKTTPEQRAALDLSNWEVAFCGAEPISADSLDRFAEAFAPSGFRADAFYPCYGLAEATLLASGGRGPTAPTIKRVSAAALSDNRIVPCSGNETIEARRLVGCGYALADQEIAIVDPATGRACDDDEVGEILLRGPSIARGYWGQPTDDEDADMFGAAGPGGHSDYLRTGDLGFVSEGTLYVTGRLKDVIIIRGRNHYPHDIELTVKNAHPSLGAGTGAACSIAQDNQERLVVIYEIDRQHRGADLDEVLRAVRRAVSEHHELELHAVALVRQASLPRTTSGKVQRHLCRQLYLDGQLKLLADWHKHDVASRGHDAEPVAGHRPVAPQEDVGPAASQNQGADRWGDVTDRMSTSAKTKTLSQIMPDALAPGTGAQGRRLNADEIDRLAERIESAMISWLIEHGGLGADEVDRARPFAEFGLDSLTAVEMIQQLEDWLKIRLNPVVAWNYPTIATLAPYLARQAGGADPDQDDQSAGQEANQEFEQLLAEIETLSDDDVQAELTETPSDDVETGGR